MDSLQTLVCLLVFIVSLAYCQDSSNPFAGLLQGNANVYANGYGDVYAGKVKEGVYGIGGRMGGNLGGSYNIGKRSVDSQLTLRKKRSIPSASDVSSSHFNTIAKRSILSAPGVPAPALPPMSIIGLFIRPVELVPNDDDVDDYFDTVIEPARERKSASDMRFRRHVN